jgi:hypothetical protein
MADTTNRSLTQMIQALASLNLSPEELKHALQSPERMTELMKRASDTNPRYAELNDDDIKQELDAVQARWQEEARLAPQKPPATRRIDLEQINREVAQEMSSRNFVLLKTFIGLEKSSSTIPITQLTIGM